MATKDDIISVCQDLITKYPNDCSAYVRAVCSKCGVLMFGNANEIVEYIERSPFRLSGSMAAIGSASQGNLVIGGMAESGHGHVVVVVDAPENIRKPYAFWGQYHALKGFSGNIGFTRGHGSITKAFKRSVLDKLIYASFNVGRLQIPSVSKGKLAFLYW